MSTANPSVLIVEDHQVFTTALLRLLQRNNVTVQAVANSAEQALEQLAEHPVDLVLVDISLPHMSGIELVSAIRQKYPDLPCMVLSGHVAKHYVQRSLSAGARGYVIKDNIDGIFTGIQRVLQGDVYISDGPGE